MTLLSQWLCPHCALDHDVVKMCPDRGSWTQDERDARRAQLRRRYPWIVFAPTTAEMQDRFGARNRQEREASRVAK